MFVSMIYMHSIYAEKMMANRISSACQTAETKYVCLCLCGEKLGYMMRWLRLHRSDVAGDWLQRLGLSLSIWIWYMGFIYSSGLSVWWRYIYIYIYRMDVIQADFAQSGGPGQTHSFATIVQIQKPFVNERAGCGCWIIRKGMVSLSLSLYLIASTQRG